MTVIRVHSLEQAQAALAAAHELNAPVMLVSPPALAVGVGWWRELLKLVGDDGQAVLDCGPSPGLALAAIRTGIRHLWLDADAPVLARIASIAEQAGGRAYLGGKVALDLLGEPDPGGTCRKALGGTGVGGTGATS